MVETRSRARGGATPHQSGVPAKTPARSTRATRSKAKQAQEEEQAAVKALDFQDAQPSTSSGGASTQDDTASFDQRGAQSCTTEPVQQTADAVEPVQQSCQGSPVSPLPATTIFETSGAAAAPAAEEAAPAQEQTAMEEDDDEIFASSPGPVPSPNTLKVLQQYEEEAAAPAAAEPDADADEPHAAAPAADTLVDEAMMDEDTFSLDAAEPSNEDAPAAEEAAEAAAPAAELATAVEEAEEAAAPAAEHATAVEEAEDIPTATTPATAVEEEEQLMSDEDNSAPAAAEEAVVPHVEEVQEEAASPAAAAEEEPLLQEPESTAAAAEGDQCEDEDMADMEEDHTETALDTIPTPTPAAPTTDDDATTPVHTDNTPLLPASEPEEHTHEDTMLMGTPLAKQHPTEFDEPEATTETSTDTSALAGMSLAPTAGSKYVSKTPQPRKATTSKIGSLTAMKPTSGTPYAARRVANAAATPEPKASTSTVSKAVHKTPGTKVTFATPGPASSGAATAGKKSVLKPSTTFKTPTPAERAEARTGGAKSAKRVSISTPLQQSAPRPIPHLTPYPKSAGKHDEDEEVEVGDAPMHEDAAGTPASPTSPGAQVTSPSAAASGSAEKLGSPASASAVEEPGSGDVSMEASMEDTAAAGDQHVAVPAEVAPQAEQQAGSAGKSSQRSPASRPTSAGKYAKAHSALVSLAQGEAQASGSRTPSYMAPTSAALHRAKIPEKLGAATKPAADDDPRSMGALRRQIKEAAAKKAAKATTTTKYSTKHEVHSDLSAVRKTRLVDKADKARPAAENEDLAGDHDQSEAPHDPAAEELLTSALGGMNLGPKASGSKPAAIAPLKGVPVPQGKHVRFNSKGKAKESPSTTRPVLRGVAPATGQHLRFKD